MSPIKQTSMTCEENLNDDEGDSDCEQEGKKNPEDKIKKKVQGQTVKHIVKHSRTNMKSTDNNKKRVHDNKSMFCFPSAQGNVIPT